MSMKHSHRSNNHNLKRRHRRSRTDMVYVTPSYKLVVIAMLITVVGSPGARCEGTDTETEAERATVLDYARNKFQHLLSSRDPADPFADVIPDMFCRTATRLSMPDICGSPTRKVPVYLVDVLPITGSPIRDIVLLSHDDEAFSLFDADGVTRVLRESDVKCSSEMEFLALVDAYLRFYYMSSQTEMVPIVMCAVDRDYPASVGACSSPEVETTVDGFEVDIYVAPVDEGFDSSPRWSMWHFGLTSSDSVFSSLLREDRSGR